MKPLQGNPCQIDPKKLLSDLQSPIAAAVVPQPVTTPQPTQEKAQETATPAASLDTIRVSRERRKKVASPKVRPDRGCHAHRNADPFGIAPTKIAIA